MYSDDPKNYQVNGDHYHRLEYQPIEFIHDLNLDFDRANAVKYLARLGHKIGTDPEQDVDKAIHYLKFYDQQRKERREKVKRFIDQFPSQFIQQAIFFICEIPSLCIAENCLDILRVRLEKGMEILDQPEEEQPDDDEDEEESEAENG